MCALGGDRGQLRTLVSTEVFTISGLNLLAGLTWPLSELGLLPTGLKVSEVLREA